MAARPPSHPAAGFPAVRVQYYRRMKPRRVYPVVVTWDKAPRPVGSVAHITLRLLAAGAQVVPSEAHLDASRADAKATFFVTPLTDSWLRSQRVEVIVQGRRVQDVPLASRVVCHCWTWVFFFLAIALPLLLLAVRNSDPDWLNQAIAEHVPSLAEVVRQNVPGLEGWWNDSWRWLGDRYADFQQFTRNRHVLFPTAVSCIVLGLWAAFRHRDRRTTRMSQPIAVTTTTTAPRDE